MSTYRGDIARRERAKRHAREQVEDYGVDPTVAEMAEQFAAESPTSTGAIVAAFIAGFDAAGDALADARDRERGAS